METTDQGLNAAQQNLAKGFNCAQSVFAAACAELGIDDDCVPCAATAFGGGFGGYGSACGALSGAMLTIGLQLGTVTPEESRGRAYVAAQKVAKKFYETMGAVNCRELIGLDISTPEGMQTYRKSDLPKTVCAKGVALAFETVVQVIREDQARRG